VPFFTEALLMSLQAFGNSILSPDLRALASHWREARGTRRMAIEPRKNAADANLATYREKIHEVANGLNAYALALEQARHW
jgi:hypothetical protein